MKKTYLAKEDNGKKMTRAPGRKDIGKGSCALCASFERCGGCTYLNRPYGEQLQIKQDRIRKLLGDICPVIHPIQGMDDPLYYRNKVHAVFGRKKDGTVLAGTYAAGSHWIVPLTTCAIDDPRADEIIRTIRDLAVSFKLQIFNEDTGRGLLRHVVIRTGYETGQILVTLVTSSFPFPSRKNFVNELVKRHPGITTIVQNINDRKTSMVMGERSRVLYGSGTITDELCGCHFRISSGSFYQVNPVQTRFLYRKAIELAALTGKERVVDAYCGIGTIGLIASCHAGEVIAVEQNPDAVRDAVFNVKQNGIGNVRIHRDDATVYMEKLATRRETANVILMDPPRSGSTERFMKAAAKLKPSRIVYVSCGPDTLARDLKYFAKLGYRAEEAWPVDMFPQTEEIETVVLLLNQNAKTKYHVNVGIDAEKYYRMKKSR